MKKKKDVCTNEGTDTAKRLRYKVPVLWVRKLVKIFINLTLRPKTKHALCKYRSWILYKSIDILFLFTAKIKSSSHSRDSEITRDKDREVRKIIQDILIEHYSALDDL